MMGDASALPAAMRFSTADLEANRQGLLSPAQIARIISLRQRKMLIAASLFLVLVLAATVLIYVGQLNRSAILFGAGAALTVINAIQVGRAGRDYMSVGGDLRRGRVEVLAGDVERVLRRGRASDSYLLRINGAELTVTKEVFVGFRHEAPYRIYRASVSRNLLSAEPMSYGLEGNCSGRK
ncbi:MAG: hypothetical protein OXG84_01130 [Chloroflexi bacterium]|nr:hypothetical protein [Chloroflexota bacterium]